ncbi:MAG: hypothetical protein LUP94_02300 [Candidatus Methanomethylicus sp.]|nr:hypothetical protein [Candidatus Methanomethylicus sp.]
MHYNNAVCIAGLLMIAAGIVIAVSDLVGNDSKALGIALGVVGILQLLVSRRSGGEVKLLSASIKARI